MPAEGLARALRGGVAALLVSGLGACSELGLVGDVATAPLAPGLRSDQPWISMPVGSWVLETGIAPRAISACFEPACEPRAVVAVFDAAGADAQRLQRTLDDPQALARALVPAPRRQGRARIAPALVHVEARREGALSGFSVTMSRADGSRTAAGYVLAARRPDATTVILVIASTEDAARRVAREVAAGL